MNNKKFILSIVTILILTTVSIFFNASKLTAKQKYKFHGEGSASVVSAGESIYKNHEIFCPDGMDVEDFYEEELKERLSECSIFDLNSGRKRKLSHIEVNAISTFIKTL